MLKMKIYFEIEKVFFMSDSRDLGGGGGVYLEGRIFWAIIAFQESCIAKYKYYLFIHHI